MTTTQIDFNKPTNIDSYVDVLPTLKNSIKAILSLSDPQIYELINAPSGSVRFNKQTKKFESYNGTVWSQLEINIKGNVTGDVEGDLDGTADKAKSDQFGDVIDITYLKTDSANETFLKIDDAKETYVKGTGNRGELAGYESLISNTSTTLIVNEVSPDSIKTTATSISVANSSTTQSYDKSILIKTSGATVTLGNKWSWIGGNAPEEINANDILILKWMGDTGRASIV